MGSKPQKVQASQFEVVLEPFLHAKVLLTAKKSRRGKGKNLILNEFKHVDLPICLFPWLLKQIQRKFNEIEVAEDYGKVQQLPKLKMRGFAVDSRFMAIKDC